MTQHSLFQPPPFVRTSKTSRAAAESLTPSKAEMQRRAVMAALVHAGKSGMTDEEIQVATGLSGNSERPSRIECRVLGFVKDSLRTRPSSSGCEATVWIAAEVAASV